MHGVDPRFRGRRNPDLNKRLPLLRDLTDLRFDEDELQADELTQAKKKKLIDLPTPYTTDVATYEQFTQKNYAAPVAYIRRILPRDPAEDDRAPAEYDLEWEDEAWLERSKYGSNGPDPRLRLPPQTMEKMIDMLEHLSGQHGPGYVIPQLEAVAAVGGRLLDLQNTTAPAAAATVGEGAADGAAAGAAAAASAAAATTAAAPSPFPLPPAMCLPLPPSATTAAGAVAVAAGPPLTPSGLPFPLSKCCEEVYGYWAGKRTKLRKPLLRRYWTPTPISDTNPHHTFRPHDKEKRQTRARTRKNDHESHARLKALSGDLSAGLGVLLAVCKREETKRVLMAVSEDMFEQALYDLTDTSGVPRKPPTLAMAEPKLKLKLKRAAAAAAAGGSGMHNNVGVSGGSVGDGPGLDDGERGGDGGGRGDRDRDREWVPREGGRAGGGYRSGGGQRGALDRDRRGGGAAGASRLGGGANMGDRLGGRGGGRGGGGLSGAAAAGGGAAAGAAAGSGLGGSASKKAGVGGLKQKAGGPIGSGGGGAASASAAAAAAAAATHAAHAASSYFAAGLRADPVTGAVTFGAGYRGFSWGPWALPRTVPDLLLKEEAELDSEDPLALGAALGLRLGTYTSPFAWEATRRDCALLQQPGAQSTLPSRASAYPMDAAAAAVAGGGSYVAPGDEDLYRADLTVQRRLVMLRNYHYGSGTWGSSWEAGGGAPGSLVAGIGSGPSASGRGWEALSGRLEWKALPFDDAMEAVNTLIERGGGAEGSSGSSSSSSSSAPSSAASSAPVDQPQYTDAWLAVSAAAPTARSSYSAAAAAATVTRPGAGGGEDTVAAVDVDGVASDYLLRPRIGRGGRLLLDRVRVGTNSSFGRHLAAATGALRLRARERSAARALTAAAMGFSPNTTAAAGDDGDGDGADIGALQMRPVLSDAAGSAAAADDDDDDGCVSVADIVSLLPPAFAAALRPALARATAAAAASSSTPSLRHSRGAAVDAAEERLATLLSTLLSSVTLASASGSYAGGGRTSAAAGPAPTSSSSASSSSMREDGTGDTTPSEGCPIAAFRSARSRRAAAATAASSALFSLSEALAPAPGLEISSLHGYTGADSDPHALHLAAFAHYYRDGRGCGVESSRAGHQTALNGGGTGVRWGGAGARAAAAAAAANSSSSCVSGASVASVRGLSSAYLAPSRFTRIGGTAGEGSASSSSSSGSRSVGGAARSLLRGGDPSSVAAALAAVDCIPGLDELMRAHGCDFVDTAELVTAAAAATSTAAVGRGAIAADAPAWLFSGETVQQQRKRRLRGGDDTAAAAAQAAAERHQTGDAGGNTAMMDEESSSSSAISAAADENTAGAAASAAHSSSCGTDGVAAAAAPPPTSTSIAAAAASGLGATLASSVRSSAAGYDLLDDAGSTLLAGQVGAAKRDDNSAASGDSTAAAAPPASGSAVTWHRYSSSAAEASSVTRPGASLSDSNSSSVMPVRWPDGGHGRVPSHVLRAALAEVFGAPAPAPLPTQHIAILEAMAAGVAVAAATATAPAAASSATADTSADAATAAAAMRTSPTLLNESATGNGPFPATTALASSSTLATQPTAAASAGPTAAAAPAPPLAPYARPLAAFVGDGYVGTPAAHGAGREVLPAPSVLALARGMDVDDAKLVELLKYDDSDDEGVVATAFAPVHRGSRAGTSQRSPYQQEQQQQQRLGGVACVGPLFPHDIGEGVVRATIASAFDDALLFTLLNSVPLDGS